MIITVCSSKISILFLYKYKIDSLELHTVIIISYTTNFLYNKYLIQHVSQMLYNKFHEGF